MATQNIRIDAIDTLKALGRMEDVLRRPQPFLQLIAEELYRVARVSFEKESSPDGTPWLPLSARYALRKSKLFPGRGILRLRGRLIRSLRRGVEGRTAYATEGPLAYAAIHQYGGKTGRKHKTMMPARPSLGFPRDSQERCARDIEELIAETFNKGQK